jgi:uncharacterized membrane protein YeaQ/YmgE (transglycosylase-associated protein family)
MAMRAATMSPMITPDHETYIREPSYFFRKLVLLVLLVTATALWTVLLFKDQEQFPSVLSASFTDIILGLVAGFGSRAVLNKRGLFLQTMIGILLAVFGMILAGSVSNSLLGVGPIALQPAAAEQLSELTFGTDIPEQIGSLKIEPGELLDLEKMNWADPLHLLGSLFMAMTALYAWRYSSPYPSQQVEVMPLAPVSTPEPRPLIRTRASSNGRSHAQPRGGLFARLRMDPAPRTGSGRWSSLTRRRRMPSAPSRDEGAREASHRSSLRWPRSIAVLIVWIQSHAMIHAV